jgi:riboflavin synthase
MFTGLVSDVGEIVAAEGDAKKLRRYVIESKYPAVSIELGASIACSGICLTAVAVKETASSGSAFTVEAAAETLARTMASEWCVGTKLNLERSLRVGDELGGHLVTGHVDGVAQIISKSAVTEASGPWGPTAEFVIRVPQDLARFIAEKGSICLDGVSLTVNKVNQDTFSVLLIPHTLDVTTFGKRASGDRIHVEIDLMARYAARLAEARALSK